MTNFDKLMKQMTKNVPGAISATANRKNSFWSSTNTL
jgi:hypothetical protein